LEKNALSFLKAAGQSPGKNGMYSAAQLAMALQAQGMSPDQIQAFMAQRSSETDPDSLKQRLGGYRSQTIEQMKNYLDSEGLVDTWFGRGKHSIAKQWKNFKVYSAERSAFTLNNAVGESTDWFDRAWNDLWWGDTIKQGDSISADSLFGRLGSQYADAGYRKLSSQEAERAKISGLRPGEDVYSANYKGFNLSRIGKDKNSFRNGRKGQAPDDMLSVKDSTGIAKAIEKMADDIDHPGSKLARQFMTETDPSKRKKILSELMRSNPKEFRSGAYNDLFIKGYSSGVSMSDVFLADLQGTQTQDIYRKVDRNGVSDFESSLDRVLGGKSGSSFDELRSIGKMGELSQLFLQGKFDATNVDELINGDPELKKLMGNRRGSQAMAYINDTVKRAMSEGRLLTGTSALRVGSLNDAIKTNGSTIMDKDIRAKFLAAKNRGDTQGMNRALSEYAVKLTGGLDKDLKINVPSDSLAKTGEAARKLLEGGAAASKDMENSMDYGVDYKGTYADIIKKFDQPMDKFGGHIENFGRFVDRLVKSNAGGGGGGVYQNNQKVLSN
ncbi:MAG TPA: hypothetical protein VFM18_02750, partial [Methanosarcina sp.]|nr:hypothetical protein [Methanosarcina sp.]